MLHLSVVEAGLELKSHQNNESSGTTAPCTEIKDEENIDAAAQLCGS